MGTVQLLPVAPVVTPGAPRSGAGVGLREAALPPADAGPAANGSRLLVALLREICAARGITLTAFSNDWIFHARQGGRSTYIFGYDLSLNSATAKLICKDKGATSELLGFHGVPRVEHRLFHGPQLAGYVPTEGNWRPMLEYFEACGGDVVIKPNEGTGGQGVFRARAAGELEVAVLRILERHRSLCLSPYEHISGGEYRVAVLQGRVQFVYRKDRPTLVGDGRRTLGELLFEQMRTARGCLSEALDVAAAAQSEIGIGRVPAAGEVVVLNWKHNLAQGAAPVLVNPAADEVRELCALAVRAAEVLHVTVASVDVVVTPSGAKVLELNSGIMMESLARELPEGLRLAREFYDRLLCLALKLDDEVPR